MNEIQEIRLNDGYSMPLCGLGVYKMLDRNQLQNAVEAAVQFGYRLFDTASVYKNELELGDALKEVGIPREKLFITTKVWNNSQRIGDVRGALERSLERLAVDYVDLYLIHWPVPGCYTQTWRELIKLREEGLVRSIGVSNFNQLQLEKIIEETDVIPAVNQIECHPLWVQTEIREYCQKFGIAVQAYAPLARGAYLDRTILSNIGKKYGKTSAQVGLRWLVQQNISVIPKSVQAPRIMQNADIFDFTLTEPEMNLIASLNENFRSANVPEDLLGTDWEHN